MKNLIFTLFTMLVMLVAVSDSNAQSDGTPFADLPPTAEYGKCYAKCKVPDVFETSSVQKLKKEAATKLVSVAAVYESASETILVKEGSTKYNTIPARFTTVTEKVLVKDAETKYSTVPAKYENRTRQVLVTPARGEWVRKKKAPNCFSSNPDDCYVACWEEVPATYRTESYQVLVTPATTVETVIPAVYNTITKTVLAEPARVEEIVVPPVYKTVPKKVLVTPAATNEIVIPAEYTTVTEKRLVSKGGYTTWQEILCAAQTTNSTVRRVQTALMAAGYNPGPIDGVLGSQTKSALVKYQQDKTLPIGNMNIETLKALGVN